MASTLLNENQNGTVMAPTYAFVYGTLKQGEANFDRWMAPFMTETTDGGSEEIAPTSPTACTCTLRFFGPALTVHRYPFVIYDYPSVINAPYTTLGNPSSASGVVGDDTLSTVFHDTPQRVLGEVYEICPCAMHTAAAVKDGVSAAMETSRVVERLDILEDTATGLYSRVTIMAEVKPPSAAAETEAADTTTNVATGQVAKDQQTVIVPAQIYFRSDSYPRDEVVQMVAASLAAGNTAGEHSEVARNDVTAAYLSQADAMLPRLLSDKTNTACVAEGRVDDATVKGFLRTFRGKDHRKIVGE